MGVNNIVKLEDVCFGYSKRLVLNRIGFQLEAGTSLAVVGPSGLGKSTLLRLVGATLMPSSGTIQICGRDTSSMSAGERRRLRRTSMGIVFQQPRLIEELSVVDNVALPEIINGRKRADARNNASALLEEFGIDIDAEVSSLSGGQASRVAVARAILRKPPLVIADEPTSALDKDNALKIASLLLGCCSAGSTVILVTHDLEIANLCSRVMHLEPVEDSSGGSRLV